MKKQSPWEGGSKAAQAHTDRLHAIVIAIVTECLDSVMKHAGDLTERDAFGVTMTVSDAISGTLIGAFVQDATPEQTKDIISNHAVNVLTRILRKREGETVQ